MKQHIERYFQLVKHDSNIRREFLAGLITFLTMSYILVVNPIVLGDAGMDKHALFTTTALATIVATLFMGLVAKLPIAQAPGMGLNTFFAYTVVVGMGYTWQFALTAVFIEGLIFLLLTAFNVRELIVKNIPKVLKQAIPVGIGLFITLIGMRNAGIIVGNPNTLLTLGSMNDHNVWIAFAGLIITGVLLIRNVAGAILIGILAATGLAIGLGDASLPSKLFAVPPSIQPIFGEAIKPMFSAAGWHQIFTLDMFVVVFTFLFVNLFDTIGTLIGVVGKTGIADEDGNFPQIKEALFSDAVGTTIGSLLGTSSVTSYVESASGVAAGGRTGLTAVSVAALFAIALFLSPIFLIIPAAATAPALIVVGLFMISSVVKINFDDMSEALPAFVTIVFMPFTSSIAEGIVYGILAYTFYKLFSGKKNQITTTTYILSVLFILKILLDIYKG